MPPPVGGWIQLGRTSLCWRAECTPGLGGWHFQSPTILRLRALGPSSWALGPDHLQDPKCSSKDAELLSRPPSESDFVAMSGLLNGWGAAALPPRGPSRHPPCVDRGSDDLGSLFYGTSCLWRGENSETGSGLTQPSRLPHPCRTLQLPRAP